MGRSTYIRYSLNVKMGTKIEHLGETLNRSATLGQYCRCRGPRLLAKTLLWRQDYDRIMTGANPLVEIPRDRVPPRCSAPGAGGSLGVSKWRDRKGFTGSYLLILSHATYAKWETTRLGHAQVVYIVGRAKPMETVHACWLQEPH